MRDLRDPEMLGRLFQSLRRMTKGAPATQVADELAAYFVPNLNANPSCIDKYGRAGEVKPLWEEIQIR